jgi:hypothetical protein
MTDTFRALCAELADDLEMSDWPYKLKEVFRADIARARAALEAQPEPQGPMPEVDDILRLAAIIRRVDGNHDKSAAALAEAILSHPDSRWQHAQPEPQGPTDEELIEPVVWMIDEGVYYNNKGDVADSLRELIARWGRPATTGEQR